MLFDGAAEPLQQDFFDSAHVRSEHAIVTLVYCSVEDFMSETEKFPIVIAG